MKVDELRARIDCLQIAASIASNAYSSSKTAQRPTAEHIVREAKRLWAFAVPARRKLELR